MGAVPPILTATRKKSLKGILCLFAALLALVWGALPPDRTVEIGGWYGTPCYGLASESSDSACLLSVKNERDAFSGCTRNAFGPGMTVPAPGTAVRVAGCSFTAPPPTSSVPRITAHHLRV